jgi:hypothetical protein
MQAGRGKREAGSGTRHSRPALVWALWAITGLSLAGAGCYHYGYDDGYYASSIGTVYGPYWYPANYGSVAFVRYPWWGDPPPPPKIDPRRDESPTRKAIDQQVRESFAGRGYKTLQGNADVDVAVYASMDPQLDISGYTHEYDWKNLPQLKDKTKYPKGTVVVDVLAPKTHRLLWRGTAVTRVTDNAEEYEKGLRIAVKRIVEKYPKSKHK